MGHKATRVAIPLAVLMFAGAAPGGASAQVNQGGRLNIPAKTADPVFVNKGPSADFMMTVCIDQGTGPSANINLVINNNLQGAVFGAAAGICRTAAFTVVSGETVEIFAPVNAVTGAYTITSPLPK